jgi:bisphosphoglycerate-independent phosphoglycerate mutase (AlkP superfamily)
VNGAGLSSGYQEDSATVAQGLGILETNHPKLVLFNLREPDFSGHEGNWNQYLAGLQRSDEYVKQIVNFIQNDPVYANKTTIFITSDHGRHLNGVADGFSGHGDNCDGCRRIGMLAIGPDFTPGTTIDKHYDLTDIPATISRLLHFKMRHAKGQSISELFD